MELYLLFCVIGALCTACHGEDSDEKTYRSNEAQLHADLMKNYTSHTRPVQRHTDTLPVQFGLSLLSIEGIDRETQILTTHAWARMLWKDYQLSWNPEKYDNIKSVGFPAEQIWHPDIHLYNGVKEGMQQTIDTRHVVSPDGSVLFIPPVVLQSRCELDYTNFPFDTQKCHLKFGSWVYHDGQLNLTLYGGPQFALDTSEFLPSKEFELVEHSVARNERKYACCVETYADITFNMTLRRRSTYATKLFLAPSIVLSLMLPAVFILPPESTEKMILGVGIMIGHVLLFGQLENFVPHAHPTMPRITVYFVTNLVLVCLSLFLSAIIVNSWGRRNRKTTLPAIVRTIFLGIFGRLLCTSRDDFIPIDETSHPVVATHPMDNNDHEFETGENDKAQMMSTYQRLVTTAEWRQLACVLDRLFLLIFTAITILVAIAIGHY